MRGMAKAFAELAANGQADGLGHHEWLGLLLDREASWRQEALRGAAAHRQTAPTGQRRGYRLSGGADTEEADPNRASISAPAGIWLHRLATVLIARAKPMSCAAQ